MGNVNNFWAIALPVGTVILGILGAFSVAVYHRYDAQKHKNEEERLDRLHQDEIEQNRLHLEAGQRVVNSVNSNNNAPRLGENLAHLPLRLEQLGMKLNVNVNGCVENAGR